MMTFKRTIQFGDCDPAGYIYTPRVAYYVVEAATEYLSALLNKPAIRAALDSGILPLTRALSIEYTGPAQWDDVLDINVTVLTISERSFSIGIEAVTEKGVIVFTAKQTQVCVSAETKQPIAIPDFLREVLLKGCD